MPDNKEPDNKEADNKEPDNTELEQSALPADFIARDQVGLQHYADLLGRWNSKINLVGRRDIGDLWPRHIEDALFLYNCLPATGAPQWILDIGTGGGLPGMVLAIVAGDFAPHRNFVLLDRSDRKIRFLLQVVAELKLTNVWPVAGDFTRPIPPIHGLEECPTSFDVICARAVAPPAQLWNDASHLLAPTGELLVACGPETRTQLPAGVQVEWLQDQQTTSGTSEPSASSNSKGAHNRGVVRLSALST